MKYTVYKVTNKISGKFYIGTHKTTDLDDNYMGSGKYLKYSISKHGVDNFEKVILYVFDTPEEMYAKEAEIVTEDFIAESNTYNLKIGGFGGFDYINKNRTYEERVEIARKGGLAQHMDKAELGKRISKGLSNSDKKLNGTLAAKILYPNSPFYRKRHTTESKAKIGAANAVHQKGKKNSQYGTCWVYNNNVSKKIEKDELNEYLTEGWIKGRKILTGERQ